MLSYYIGNLLFENLKLAEKIISFILYKLFYERLYSITIGITF